MFFLLLFLLTFSLVRAGTRAILLGKYRLHSITTHSISLQRLGVDDIYRCSDNSLVYQRSERRDRSICLIIALDSCMMQRSEETEREWETWNEVQFDYWSASEVCSYTICCRCMSSSLFPSSSSFLSLSEHFSPLGMFLVFANIRVKRFEE